MATRVCSSGVRIPARPVVEYHARMIALRIKQRPILFTAWFLLSAFLLASVATFITGVGYFGNTKQVMFISGGLLSRMHPWKALRWD